MHDRSPCNVWGCLIWRNICHAQSAIRHYLRLVNRGHGSDMCGGNGRMGGGTSGRLLRNPIARRQVDVDFSDLLDHFALDRNTRGDSPLHRIQSRCAKVHVGGACSRAGKARVVVKSGRHAQGARAAQLIPAKPVGSIVREARAKSYPSLCGR
jgi:hypothetical protein